MKKVNAFLNKFKKKPRNSTNKRKGSPKKGSPPKRKQIRSPGRNRVSVGDRAGTSGLRNSPRRSFSPERSFYPDSLNDSAFNANHSFARDPKRRSFFGRIRSSFKKYAPRRSQMFKTKDLQLSPIAEGQQIQLSPAAEVKKRESLINKVSKEMAVELFNNNMILQPGNKYYNRGVPSDVLAEAYEKAIIAKKDLLAMWAKEENDHKKSKILYRQPFSMRKGYPGIYHSPGSTRRKVPAKYTKRPVYLKQQLSHQRIVKFLLDQYDQGNFYPDLPLNQQPFRIPSEYEVDPESYAKALKLFKRINALGPYNVDKTPVYSDSNYLKSPTNDITRSDVLGLRQRRHYYNGTQFSPGEVKKLQKKITDMYKDEDYEEPIVEEQPEDQHGDNFGLTKFDPDEQFETEHYGTDSDDDL